MAGRSNVLHSRGIILSLLKFFSWILESKSAKKNKKRRAGKKAVEAFEVEEDVSLPGKSSAASPPQPPADPIGDLKRQIEEAKAAKVADMHRDIMTLLVRGAKCIM